MRGCCRLRTVGSTGRSHDDGEGAGQDGEYPLQRAPASPCDFFEVAAAGGPGSGEFRASRCGKTTGCWRTGALDGGRRPPRGVVGGLRDGAGEHVVAAVADVGREPFDLLARVSSVERAGTVGCWDARLSGEPAVRGRVCALRARPREAAPQGVEAPAAGHPPRDVPVRRVRDRVHELRSSLRRRSRSIPRPLAGLVFKRFKSLANLGPCPSTTTRVPGRGSTASSWWPCWSRSSSATPRPFPPGATECRHDRRRSPWRDFRFAFNQVARAIEPALPLARMIREWNRISESLADPPRDRRMQLARHFGN